MTWKEVSKFLVDHGVAITLVFLYILWIYPAQVQERKEWLIQITLLQEALDPSKRQVTSDQAQLILDLATESYVQSIESDMGRFGFFGGGIGYGYGGQMAPINEGEDSDIKIAYIFGKPFVIKLSSDVDVDVNLKANELISEYERMVKKQKIFSKQNAEQTLTKAVASARFATSGLRSFNYGNKKLSEYWDSAFSKHYSQFNKDIITAYENQIENGFSKDQLIGLLQSAGAAIPDKLLEIREYKQPSQIMYEFKSNIKTTWTAEAKKDVSSSSVFSLSEP